MGKKRKSVLATQEVVEVIADALTDCLTAGVAVIDVEALVSAEAAKLGPMDAKAKDSILNNLRQYYKAQEKSR